jgi:5-hydroxyisourate hydrolase-like protein (transthyretin family)
MRGRPGGCAVSAHATCRGRRRSTLDLFAAGVCILAVAVLCGLAAPKPAVAATDDDIPGVPAPSSPIVGSLSAEDQHDVYAIPVAAGKVLHVSLSADEGTDFDASLFAPSSTSIADGGAVADADGSSYPDDFFYGAESGGTYYLDVCAYDGAGSYTLTYRIEDAAHISGTVTNVGGSGLTGIDVIAYQWSEVYGDWVYAGVAGTAGDGDYTFDSLAQGRYRLRFADSAGVYLPEYYDDKPDLDTANDVTVTAGATAAGIDAVLTEGGHITGKVSNTEGVGLADIEVSVYQWTSDYGVWTRVSDVSTSDDGRYDVHGLTGGSYRLQFRDPSLAYHGECYDDKATIEGATDVAVTAGSTTADIDAVLAPTGHVAGRVTGAGGSGLADIEVVAYQWSDVFGAWRYVSETTTAGDGRYDLPGLASGTCRIWFVDSAAGAYLAEYYNDKATLGVADDIDVTSGSTTAGIDAVLSPAGRITGTVTVGGGDPGFVRVLCYDAQGGLVAQATTGGEEGRPGGAYVLGGLTSGNYRVKFSFNGVLEKYYDGKDTLEAADPVAVTVGQTVAGIDLAVDGPTVTSLTSATNPDPSVWYTTNAPVVSWTAAGGVGAITGYSYVFDHDPDTAPATTVKTAATSLTLPVSVDGIWYFHLRARDGYSSPHWSPTETLMMRIDATPPTTTDDHATVALVAPAVVTLTATDAMSGMAGGDATTVYAVDGGAQTAGTSITLGAGAHTVTYHSVDNAGNVEATQSFAVTVTGEPTPTPTPTPTITPTPTPTPTITPTPTPTPTPIKPVLALKLSGLRSGAIKLGRSVTAKGTVTPTSLAGRKVKLTAQLKKGRKWVRARTVSASIGTSGVYSWRYKPSRRGAYRVQAAIAKSDTTVAVVTKWRAFRVK